MEKKECDCGLIQQPPPLKNLTYRCSSTNFYGSNTHYGIGFLYLNTHSIFGFSKVDIPETLNGDSNAVIPSFKMLALFPLKLYNIKIESTHDIQFNYPLTLYTFNNGIKYKAKEIDFNLAKSNTQVNFKDAGAALRLLEVNLDMNLRANDILVLEVPAGVTTYITLTPIAYRY